MASRQMSSLAARVAAPTAVASVRSATSSPTSALFALVICALTGWASPGLANGGLCCACVAGDTATSAGAPKGDLIPALFCAEIQGMGAFISFSEACSAKWGSVVCAEPPPCATSDEEVECQVAPHPSCAAQLAAEEFIACPTAAVPVASTAPLGALAVGLVAVGTALLARRRRRGV